MMLENGKITEIIFDEDGNEVDGDLWIRAEESISHYIVGSATREVYSLIKDAPLDNYNLVFKSYPRYR